MVKKKSNLTSKSLPRFFHIVGVGASAGGLEAFSDLVKALNPKIDKAFVFVQHLDRTHESLLVQLLSHLTEIKVLEIADKMILEPNRIYVLPPNFKVKYMQGMFRLLPREESSDGFCPIDFLFASLAIECKERAI
jgi:two-component system CheB/CheR fusion protein